MSPKKIHAPERARNSPHRHVGVVVDEETFRRLHAMAAHLNLSLSVYLRELYATAIGSSFTPSERGWQEGYRAAYVRVVNFWQDRLSRVAVEAQEVGLDIMPEDVNNE